MSDESGAWGTSSSGIWGVSSGVCAVSAGVEDTVTGAAARASSRCPVEEEREPSALTDMISRSLRTNVSWKGLSWVFTISNSWSGMGTTYSK